MCVALIAALQLLLHGLSLGERETGEEWTLGRSLPLTDTVIKPIPRPVSAERKLISPRICESVLFKDCSGYRKPLLLLTTSSANR